MTRKPPFRADHVGSLLRPQYLLEARSRAEKCEITPDELSAIEDQAIRDVVNLQEQAGLHAITDGEFRRAAWHTDFLTALDGIEATQTSYSVSFHDDEGHEETIATMMKVTGKVRWTAPIMLEPFEFLKKTTKRTAKVSMPSPTYVHLRGGRKTVPEAIYPDMDEFWGDVVAAYRAEISALAAAGCTYVQLDDVSIAFLCDETIRAQIRADGLSPDELAATYADVINRIVRNQPSGMRFAMHTCRGNHHSLWMAEGGYDAVAEAVFAGAGVDGFFLEFDTPRAGGFEPLRFVPKGTRVVLGLVSSKLPALESADVLKRRIDEASRYVSLDDLAISPQCGFASTAGGNQITTQIERQKLELLVKVAEDVWGSAA